MVVKEDIEFVTRETLYSAIAVDPLAIRFRELLEESKDARVVVVKSTCPAEGINRLLFIEGGLFQHYILSNSLSFLSLEDQARILLATPITADSLWELSSEISFRNRWVTNSDRRAHVIRTIALSCL